ncbi:MAG: ribosome biogenesis GTPase Der [Anaerolineae bacterium]|nr:ribosome biogenesis GTPase Der [Anaerolineae bacterium]
MSKPIVAIVGRPNVGKSTLFNRVVGQRLAITHEVPGTTRDRLYAEAEWGGVSFILVDTGGLEIQSSKLKVQKRLEDDLMAQVRAQAQIAIAEADVILFLVDVKDGLTAGDEEVAQVLRCTAKPVLLAVNKAESQARREEAVEFYALGLGELYPISALHGTGTGDLLDQVVGAFPVEEEEEELEAIKIAIVGRPNVGKSSLLNKILGQERSIVHDVPGTTRDAIDTEIEWEGEPLVLIDTAGIRRKGRIQRGVEKYSVLRALKAIDRADVVLLLIDAVEGATAQDAHIAGYILEEAKSVVVVVNKWDLVEKDTYTMQIYIEHIYTVLSFLDYVPALFISALTGQRVDQVLPTALRVQEARLIRIPTAELNRILQEAVARHSPPSKAGKRLKFYYVTQPRVDPPTFVFFVNDPRLVHFSYQRYLENRLREHYGFLGTPLRLSFRKRGKG